MKPRFKYDISSHGGMQALIALEKYPANSSLEEGLINMVKMRAS